MEKVCLPLINNVKLPPFDLVLHIESQYFDKNYI